MATTEKEMCDVMRNNLNMRYRKIIPISMTANSPRNLVLRQQFAIKFIEILNSGKRVINVDESLLGQSDFRKRKWMVPGTSNSVAKKALQPRVSMIAALDNLGGVFISLVQGNSNSKIMEIYFQNLCRKLEK